MLQTDLARKIDRRRFTRVPMRQLRSTVLSPWIGLTDVWVVDLSLGGAFLRTPTPLPVGETMSLRLPRTHGGTLQLPTRVVATRGQGRPGVGVSFDALDPMSLVELRDLLRSLAPPGTPLMIARPQESDRTVVAARPAVSPTPPRVPPATQLAPKITQWGPQAAHPALQLTQPAPQAPQPRPSMPVLSAARAVPIEELPPAPAPTRLLEGKLKALQEQLLDLRAKLDAKTREAEALREAVTRLQAANTALRRGLGN